MAGATRDAADVRPQNRRLHKMASMWHRDADLAHKVDAHEGLRRVSGWRLLGLAFSSLGVVYGDIGTSPLYTFTTVFAKLDPTDHDLVMGTFAMVFWTLTLVCGVQYIGMLLFMDDNGEGGTFALYSLICRAANIRAGGRIHETEMGLSGFDQGNGDDDQGKRRRRRSVGQRVRRALASSRSMQHVLLCAVMVGVCLVMADGILTPSISVVSAVQGVQLKAGISDSAVAGISIGILVALFSIQPFGTERISLLFAPVLLLWFACNAAIGMYNIAKYGPGVFRAMSPYYVYRYWSGNGHQGWIGLGSIFLSITGCEALYADLGHFSGPAIRISFVAVVYPSLVLSYLGQTALLLRRPGIADNVYWQSVPQSLFYPMLVIGTVAAIVASQALITGSFTITQQAVSHGIFPRFTIRHTSARNRGQIYVPQVNWALMVGCIAVVGIFKTGSALGNAYGLAVVMVMLLSTWLAAACMLITFGIHPALIAAYLLVFTFVEAAYLSSNLAKVPEGAWFPLAVCAALFALAYTWQWGQSLKAAYIAAHKKKLGQLLVPAPSHAVASGAANGAARGAEGAHAAHAGLPVRLGPRRLGGQAALQLSDGTPVARIPGVGVYFSELLDGVPPVMARFLAAVPSVHDVVVLLTIRQVPVPHVLPEEALLIRKLALPSFYHCVVRSGYMDDVRLDEGFEALMINELMSYLAPDVVEDAEAEAQALGGGGGGGGQGLLLARLMLPRSAPARSRLSRASTASSRSLAPGEGDADVEAVPIDADAAPKSPNEAVQLPAWRDLAAGGPPTAMLMSMSFNRRAAANKRPPLPPPSAFAVPPQAGGDDDDSGSEGSGDGGSGGGAAAGASRQAALPWVQQPSIYRRVRSMAVPSGGHLTAPTPHPPRPPLSGLSAAGASWRSTPLPADEAAHPPLQRVLESMDLEQGLSGAHAALAPGTAAPAPAPATARQGGALAPEQQQDGPGTGAEPHKRRLFRAMTVSSSGALGVRAGAAADECAADRERLRAAHAHGAFFLIGKSKLGVAEGRRFLSRFVLENVYNSLVDNTPATTDVYHVPNTKTLELSVRYLV